MMDLEVLDLQLDSMILKVYSNLHDSMIPRFTYLTGDQSWNFGLRNTSLKNRIDF